jgi:hypothetical protein
MDIGGAGCWLQPGRKVGAVGLKVSPQAADQDLPLFADPPVLVEGHRSDQGAGVEEVEEVGGGEGHLD